MQGLLLGRENVPAKRVLEMDMRALPGAVPGHAHPLPFPTACPRLGLVAAGGSQHSDPHGRAAAAHSRSCRSPGPDPVQQLVMRVPSCLDAG